METQKSSRGMLLIVAMVVIMSILAAGSIISAAGGLERVSMATLHGTEKNVGSTIVVFYVIGDDGSDDGKIENMDLFLNLGPASRSMNWSSTKITIDRADDYQTLLYAGLGVKKPTGFEDFSVYYLQRQQKDGIPDHIYKGDRAQVSLRLDPPVTPEEKIFIQIIPEYGNICRLSFKTPQTMISKRVELYP